MLRKIGNWIADRMSFEGSARMCVAQRTLALLEPNPKLRDYRYSLIRDRVVGQSFLDRHSSYTSDEMEFRNVFIKSVLKEIAGKCPFGHRACKKYNV